MNRTIQAAISIVALLTPIDLTARAQEAVATTQKELAAITERGRLLYEYDQAAWHASDAVQMANPKNVEGQRYIAKKENGKWTVVFGKLNEDRSRFGISYEAEERRRCGSLPCGRNRRSAKTKGFFFARPARSNWR